MSSILASSTQSWRVVQSPVLVAPAARDVAASSAIGCGSCAGAVGGISPSITLKMLGCLSKSFVPAPIPGIGKERSTKKAISREPQPGCRLGIYAGNRHTLPLIRNCRLGINAENRHTLSVIGHFIRSRTPLTNCTRDKKWWPSKVGGQDANQGRPGRCHELPLSTACMKLRPRRPSTGVRAKR